MAVDLVIIGFLLLFVLLVVLIFGPRRRWLGLAGWLLVVGAFGTNLLAVRTAPPALSLLTALLIAAGLGLAWLDYLRYDRRRARWHKLSGIPFRVYRLPLALFHAMLRKRRMLLPRRQTTDHKH